jgi:aspartyl-tRNA(Asn)/glutamyl-tRNA(Gln) amidotransferase subunit C
MARPSDRTEPQIDAATAARVAQLARLGLDEAELRRTAEQLGGILGHFRALQGVDTSGVEVVQAGAAPGAPGADVIEPFPQPRSTLLPLTAHAREGFFVVPAVLDTDFGEERSPARPAAGGDAGHHASPHAGHEPGNDASPGAWTDDDPGADA